MKFSYSENHADFPMVYSIVINWLLSKLSIKKHWLQKEYVFSVGNNCLGTDLKYHTKIIKIFSQLNVNNGLEITGIGLAIVKRIIRENNGVISLESEEGIEVR